MLRSRPKPPSPKPERITRWPGVQKFAPEAQVAGMGTAVPKIIARRNQHLLDMARNRPCLLQIPGVCNRRTDTSVACHSNFSIHQKGGHRKADDCYSVWGCSACHAWLDQGNTAPHDEKLTRFLMAHGRQVEEWMRIVADMVQSPKDRRAAHWALMQLQEDMEVTTC